MTMRKVNLIVLQIALLLRMVVGVTDDYPQDISTPYYIQVGNYIPGTIETVGDQDWFKVYVVSGRTYHFAVDGSSSSLNPKIDIYDSTGATVRCSNDDITGTNKNAMCSFTPTSLTAGILIFKASASTSSSTTGAYKAFFLETSFSCSSECSSCLTISPAVSYLPTSYMCRACQVNKLGLGSSCVSSCPAYHINDGRVCKTCGAGQYYSVRNGNETCFDCSRLDPLCQSCSSADQCYSCPGNRYNHGPACVTICPIGTYTSSMSCIDCFKLDPFCDECSSSTVCTACSHGKFASGSVCVDSCPASTYSYGSRCYVTCPTGTRIDGTTCVDSCPSGKYDDGTQCRGKTMFFAKLNYFISMYNFEYKLSLMFKCESLYSMLR